MCENECGCNYVRPVWTVMYAVTAYAYIRMYAYAVADMDTKTQIRLHMDGHRTCIHTVTAYAYIQ